MTTDVKTVMKRVKNIEEIRSHTIVCTLFGNANCYCLREVYRSDKVSYETARRWKEKFLTTPESVKYAANLADL